MFLNELHFEQLKQDRERDFASLRCVPQQPRLDPVSIRRSIGRSIMQIGAWLAAEPYASRSQTERALRLARSR
jgi:hypothetical protein